MRSNRRRVPANHRPRHPRMPQARTIGRWMTLAGLALTLLATAAQAADKASLQAVVDEAHARFSAVTEGALADYIPALTEADPDDFAITIVTVDGEVVGQGDTDVPFAIMSVAKPFTLALLMQQQGTDLVMEKIGVEATGLRFNSLSGIDRDEGRPLNPMVNAGAIATVSLIEADSPEQRWSRILGFYERLAGEPLDLLEDVYASVSATNFRNRAVVNLLQANARLGADPDSTLDIYNRQSCVAVTTRQLAVMGATLANGGTNPASGAQVLDAGSVDELLAILMLNGLYDESGAWAVRAGLPAKSGVGGGIVAVVPGKMAIAAYSPLLSATGNSVRAMGAIEFISREQDLSVFRP